MCKNMSQISAIKWYYLTYYYQNFVNYLEANIPRKYGHQAHYTVSSTVINKLGTQNNQTEKINHF